MSELQQIQAKLKAPKGQYNKFGSYSYRSCEDILEALKPLLAEYECYIVMSDSVEAVGDRVYIKATASLKKDGKVIEEASAYAREALTKKGMDESQITGSASSYARKYALNGLFAIDDTKDVDIKDNTKPDISGEIKRIEQAKEIDDLVEVWKELASKYRGTEELKELSKAKDKRKEELMQ